jgi:hypothetical protein
VFKVHLRSQFLIIESHANVKGVDIYIISPKYDLKEWAKYSEVHVGDIEVELIGNTHPEAKPFHVSICVIQYANDDKNDVITTVNPVGNHLKLESHQVMEVVCYEREWSANQNFSDQWDFDLAHRELFLQLVKHEVLGDKYEPPVEDGIFVLKNRYHLTVNPKLDDICRQLVETELENSCPPIREHHWWFAFTKTSQEKINKSSNQLCNVCDATFNGMYRDVSNSVTSNIRRSVFVHLNINAKRKNKMYPSLIDESSVEGKMELCRRVEDRNKEKGLLINPSGLEHVDFNYDFKELIVEVIQPNVFWVDLKDEDRWKFYIDESISSPKFVNIQEMNDFYRSGRRWQRIKITHIFTHNAGESKHLGTVKIICHNKENCGGSVKNLSCWMTPDGKNKAIITNLPSRTYEKKFGNSYQTPYNSHRSRHEDFHSRHPHDGKFHGVLSLSKVEMEEIDFASLEEKEKYKKMSEVVDLKKKEALQTGENFPLCPRKKQEQSESVIEKQESTRFTNDGRPTLVVLNPAHMDDIEFHCNQKILLKFPQKAQIDSADLWRVAYDDVLKVDIEQNGNTIYGKQIYQEITITPHREVIPTVPGRHSVGSILLRRGEDDAILLMLTAKVSEEDLVSKVMKVANSWTTQSKHRIVSQWLHNDSVVISPIEALYVRNTESHSDWNSSRWQVMVEQQPLPKSVWDKLGGAYKQSCWFTNAPPMSFNKENVLLHPVMSNKANAVVIKLLAEELKIDRFLIAKITFRNTCWKHNIRTNTPYGLIENSCKLEKTIGVFLSLKVPEKKPLVVISPKDEQEVSIGVDVEDICVKLIPDWVTVKSEESSREIESPWMLTGLPGFISYKTVIPRDGGFNSFNFTVIDDAVRPAKGHIKFHCNEKERKILVELK